VFLRETPGNYVGGKGEGTVQFTLREKRRIGIMLALWVLATVLCAVAGPFGTLDALSPVPRLAYWALVSGVSTLGSLLLILNGPYRLGRAVLYVLGLSGFLHMLNAWVFGEWQGWALFGYLLGVVGVTTAVVYGAVFLVKAAHPPTDPAPSETGTGLNPFLRRIPIEQRGTLQRLEAQDHYVLAVTDKGQSLILIRFADALAEVSTLPGLQVHRSHWVSPEAVMRSRRDNGRDLLDMADGAAVPVSRKFKPAAKEAGLL